MAVHKISVSLPIADERFVEWMAERDGVTFDRELLIMLNTELYHLKIMYEEDSK